MTIISNPKYSGKYSRPDHIKKRPAVIERGITNFERFHQAPYQWLPDLRHCRIDRRYAIKQLGQVLLDYTDLLTLRVGIPNTNGQLSYQTLNMLAKRAGLGLKRAQRALHDLIQHGYIQSFPRHYKIADNEFYGLPAIRLVAKKLFYHLGISHTKLEFYRHAKRKQTDKAQHKDKDAPQPKKRLAPSLTQLITLQAVELRLAQPHLSGYQIFKARLYREKPS